MCDLYIYLWNIGIYDLSVPSIHKHNIDRERERDNRGKQTLSDSKSLQLPPLKRKKGSKERDGVKKADDREKETHLYLSLLHYPHIYDHDYHFFFFEQIIKNLV